MNILDENILETQRRLLRSWRVAVRHIGYDVGRQGMKDREILPFLHQSRRSTFFTRDEDFYDRNLCQVRYCLVSLAIRKDEVAIFVRRLLRHREFSTEAKRMGAVIRVTHVGLSVWRLHTEKEVHLGWTV